MSKKERDAEILAHARQCKQDLKVQAEKRQNLEALFWHGAPEDTDMDSKEEIYVMAMKRIDSKWTFKDVTDISGACYNTLKEYHKVWKSESEENFRYHVTNKKRGRQLFEPLSLPKMLKLNSDIIDAEHAELLCNKQAAYDNVIAPVLKMEAEAKGGNALAGVRRSKTAIARLVDAVIPNPTSTTKRSIKNRKAAKESPFGGMSFVAMFPQLVRDICMENWIFIDSVPLVLFDPSKNQNRAYISDEVKERLDSQRAAPKAQDAGGQKRAMKVNIAMAWGLEALVAGTAMIFDHEIKTIQKFSITSYLDVIFAPYSEADEVANESGQQAAESLDTRVNHVLYADCICPKMTARIRRLVEWAQTNNIDPERFKKCRLFQDGEGGPLKNIVDHFAQEWQEIQAYFAKLPNALTGEVQIGDRTGAHPALHKAFESVAFKTMSEETVQEIAGRMPGLKTALQFLQTSGISAAGQISYRRALAYLPEVLQRCVTPAVVTEAMRNSGYAPFNPNVIMNNCWVDFKHLSKVEAVEFVRIAETSVRAITERNGIVFPQECMDALQASEMLNETIKFPEVRENFEDLAWNRQLTIDLSHAHVASLVAGRAAAAAAAEEVRVEQAATQAEQARRDNLRYDHCHDGQAWNEAKRIMTHKCKCGGKFSNGMSGFKAHEKSSNAHKERYTLEYWNRFYANNPPQPVAAPQLVPPALAQAAADQSLEAGAPAPVSPAPVLRRARGGEEAGSPRRAQVSPRRLIRSPGAVINGQYVAPSWLRE
jgi:hypothetical protein